MNETSIVLMTRAEQMLVKATTIQKAKELKDLALTAKQWATRKGLGKKIIQHCTLYAIEAEIRIGELIIAGQKAGQIEKPGGNRKNIIIEYTDNDIRPAKLKELGITPDGSAQAQKIANAPVEIKEKLRAGKISLSKAMKMTSAAEREEIIKTIVIKPSERWSVDLGDINIYQTEKRFDFIITDPPYPKEYINLYGVLAKRAKEWLKPDGLLLAMCGQSYLNEIYKIMSAELKYYWTACYLTLGQSTPLRTRQVNTSWKPILIYALSEKYSGKTFGDVFKSDTSDKDFDEWGQSVSGMFSLIKQVCLPGQFIFDPFVGTGTTGVAALQYGCLFHGIDIDEKKVEISKKRLTKVINDQTKI